jgi:predicted RNase H-like HicB family nuclease
MDKGKQGAMLTSYIAAAMWNATFEILSDTKKYYGEIPGFDGVWATADNLAACQEELREVLEEWILLRVSRGLPLPAVDGIELKFTEVREVA